MHFGYWPLATSVGGLAEVSCRRQSRLDLLTASITARDPKRSSGTSNDLPFAVVHRDKHFIDEVFRLHFFYDVLLKFVEQAPMRLGLTVDHPNVAKEVAKRVTA